MFPLNPIIQDGHNHAFTCVAQLPGSFGIQVTVVFIVLRARRQKANSSEGIELADTPIITRGQKSS